MAHGSTPDPASDRRSRVIGNLLDEIVVALPHLELVLDALNGHGSEQLRDERLGLARVAVRDLPDAAAAFAPRVSTAGGGPMDLTQPAAADDLDVLLTGLRLSFAARFGGWVPTMGKNRELVGGEGTPAIKWLKPGPLGRDAAPEPAPGSGTPYAESPRDVREGGAGVRIGLLDTKIVPGVTLDDRLEARPEDFWAEPTEPTGPTEPWPFRAGHGTFLAGLLHQYAPAATIVPEPVLTGPDATATAWDVAVGLLDLVRPRAGTRDPVHLVVLALGCFTRDARPPLVLQTAVDLVRGDVVLVAAGGNYADLTMTETRGTGVTGRSPLWPAALDGVTAIGSRDGADEVSPFSPRVPWIDLTAPGEQLASEYLTGDVEIPDGAGGTRVVSFTGHAGWGGTSMSAAVAAGRLAVLRTGSEPLRATLARVLAGGDAPYLRKVPW